MSKRTVDLFAGPGGWDVAAEALGIPGTGIELDTAACKTREAAGHETVQADIAAFDPGELGKVWGLIGSPPCTTFSAAGDQAGNAITGHLAALIRDLFAGRDTRVEHRLAMTAALTEAGWPDTGMLPEKRAAKIAQAVLSASLAGEPARFIHACAPEWVTLEQVPAVLPLWQVYAAELRKMGYHVWTGKLNAADYGVPQTRERAILIASRVRRAARPEPTHYDDRKGTQLWGTPWVSMATALGWGATGRSAPTVTAGGTKTGGAEPFGHRDRDALKATQETGQWTLRTSYGTPAAGAKSTGTGSHGTHEMDPAERPAHVVTTKAKDWVLHTNRDQRPDGTRQTADPQTAPAPTLTSKSGGQWVFRNNNNNNACERSLDEPAGTLFFGHRSNWAAFQAGQESVRITVEEAAVLQSFPPDYPWQGTKTKRFEQVGNAVPPLLAVAVLGVATGIDWLPVAERYAQALYGHREAA